MRTKSTFIYRNANTGFAAYPTKLAEQFANKALQIYYWGSVSEGITNNDYEGQIKDQSSILNVLTFGAISSHDYTGADMTADDLTESNGQVKTDQAKYFYFRIKSYDKFRSYIKKPDGTIIEQTGNELKKVVDKYILAFYDRAGAGNRIGTSVTGGTVTVTTVTGAVVAAGATPFSAANVGRGFKAAGHSKWYRVATYTDSTHITIVDDLDDTGSGAYTGGTIAGGATYEIEANTAIQITKSNVYDYFNKLSEKLDDQEIPEDNRFTAVPPQIHTLIKEAPEYIPSGSEVARQEVVKRGRVGDFAGFTVYKASNQRIVGDSVNGWHVLAGHRSAITYAMGLTENGTEDAIGNFGVKYKSLYVYGAKVIDERRKALCELFAKL
jgi:hypothetical protein